MYDKNSSSSTATSTMPQLSSDGDEAEATWDSLHRLRTAVVELSIALNQTLRDDKSNAEACLQRVKAMLHTEEDAASQPAKNDVRRGLAPWQLRRVLAHLEANLNTPIRNKDLAAVAHLSTFHSAVAFRNRVVESPH